MNSNSYKIGDTYLVTTDDWFIASDGDQYKAVWGTLKAVETDKILGIQTNRHSANWFLVIGDMTVAGCQVHYTIKSPSCNFQPITRMVDGVGTEELKSWIYNADKSGA